MKLKVMAQVTVLLVLSACIAQAASTITVIGRHPFHQPPLESADDLREMMLEQQMEVEEGLEEAGDLIQNRAGFWTLGAIGRGFFQDKFEVLGVQNVLGQTLN